MRMAAGVIGVAATAVLLVGCAHITAGTARPERDTSGSGLSRVLLSEDEINAIMGASGMEVVDSSEDMADSSDNVSDTKCLGALYNGEAAAYDGTGWTEVVDQAITEPEDDSGHWVEQTVVRFPSAEGAREFLNTSKNQWTNCIGTEVTVDDGGHEFTWRFLGISMDGDSVIQSARQQDGGGWSCQHVLKAVSDVIVETAACGMQMDDEAVTIADKIADNVR